MPAPRQRPPKGRDAAARLGERETIAAHARRLFPAQVVQDLLAIVDARYDDAVKSGASPEVLARLADAAIALNEALRDGEYASYRTAEGWHALGAALRQADAGIRTLGELIADCDEVRIVMAAAAKRR